MSEQHDVKLADVIEAEQYRRRPRRGWFECPTHGERVRVENGRPTGRCSGCAGEAARGIRLIRSRITTAGTGSNLGGLSAGAREGGHHA